MSSQISRGIVAVIRTTSPQHALTLARGLADTQVAAIEVTLTVPRAVDVIAQLTAEGVPRVGAGTVRTAEQVEACVRAGAEFIVSPHTNPDIIATARRLGVAVVPGVLTPTEVVNALELQATAVKIFPVNSVGGLSYVQAILEPLPDARIVVSGGISSEEVPSYLAGGAWGVCMGSALWQKESVEAGDVDAVHAFATIVLGEALCGSD